VREGPHSEGGGGCRQRGLGGGEGVNPVWRGNSVSTVRSRVVLVLHEEGVCARGVKDDRAPRQKSDVRDIKDLSFNTCEKKRRPLSEKSPLLFGKILLWAKAGLKKKKGFSRQREYGACIADGRKRRGIHPRSSGAKKNHGLEVSIQENRNERGKSPRLVFDWKAKPPSP